MEGGKKRKTNNIAMEENIMAILDVYGASDSSHLNADRIRFLEAVRSACIIPEDGPPPTNKMHEAVFKIFSDSKCLELVMASYQLLIDLDKRFQRVYYEGKSSSPNPSGHVIIGEAWSPFAFGLDAISSCDAKNIKCGRLNQSEFYHHLQSLAATSSGTDVYSLDIEVLSKMLLFQYLVSLIEGDFCPRHSAFLDTLNWTFLRESILSLLLGSRRINYKDLVRYCTSLMSRPFAINPGSDFIEKPSENLTTETYDMALALALPEVRKDTFAAARKLVLMMLELDSSRKKADFERLTSRADGVRTPVMEIIQDELSYNKDMIHSFLQAVSEPKLKLEIILNHIQKYMARPSTRTRSSDSLKDGPTLQGVFKLFSDSKNAKNMMKKIGTEVTQVLLSHVFQACMSLTHKQLLEAMSIPKETSGSPLPELCNSIVSAFKCLRSVDMHMEILPVAKDALFAAAALLTTK